MSDLREKFLFLITCNHEHTSLEEREKYSVPKEKLGILYENLLQIAGISEIFVLSTCNRVEIFGVTSHIIGINEVQERFSRVVNVSEKRFERHSEILYGKAVVEHLFGLATGIKSQMVGETEILGQLKESYKDALEKRYVGKILNRIIQKSFQVGKWCRTHTDISQGQISIGNITAELATRIYGDLAQTRIIVLGGGEVGELTLQALKSRGAHQLTVANRTYERAAELAQKYAGNAIHFELFPKMLNLYDIVIASTSASETLIHSNFLKDALKSRPGLPLFLVDLAVPRNICPTASALENTFLYNVNDLSSIANENLRARQGEIEKCETKIAVRTKALWDHLLGTDRIVLEKNPEIQSSTPLIEAKESLN